MKTRKTRFIILLSLLALTAIALLDLLLIDSSPLKLLLSLTYTESATPPRFGSLHLSFIAISVISIVAGTALSHRLMRGREKEALDRIAFALGVVFFILELYKQLYSSFILYPDTYNFGSLPMQICSYITPCLLIAPLLNEGKLKESVYSFTSLFLTMGGCLVVAYPKFYPDIARSVHTMIWHSLMIFAGALILSTRTMRISYRRAILPSSAIFLSTLSLATLLNIVLAPVAESSPEPLNLFHMSPYHKNTFIIIGDVLEAFGFVPGLLCYILLYLTIGIHTVYLYGYISDKVIKTLRQNRPKT